MTKIFRKKNKIGKEAGSGFILLLLLKLLFIFSYSWFCLSAIAFIRGNFYWLFVITKNAE